MQKLAIIASAAILAAASPALADDWDFLLTNNTGKPIEKIEVAPSDSGVWAENKVDTELNKTGKVKPGGKTTVHFEKSPSVCKFDLRATFEDKSSAIWSTINVCEYSYVIIAFTGGKPTYKVN
ncbi:hypothetical protein [Sphingomonas pokkalii]|uniref:Argininosuccinate lyase n=1 Tax=Sphingomonas pokkalii TaxID=2175090 RepID=A0A2U0SCD0_9SPHN|nr:hypothetical protein [Sphingomonas pokkalii]PVX28980.1 hypothetical protein DD559_06220 [Sphingomonas pokkalii]